MQIFTDDLCPLPSSIWYWCADQVIVQRTLSAKNISHAKAGCVLASVLKFLPLFLLVFPGMAARVLYTNEVACSDPDKCMDICSSEAGCTNIAYVKLVLDLMPQGVILNKSCLDAINLQFN